MRTMIPLATLMALTQGCIYHDSEDCRDGGDCWGWWDDDDCYDDDDECPDDEGPDTDPDSDSDSDPDTEPEPVYSLHVTPNHAEAGSDAMVRLSAEGDFDIWSIEGVRFGGGIDVLSTVVRDAHVLLVVDLPMQAELGATDVVVDLDDGTRVVLVSAFSIDEPGAGSDDPCE